MRGTQDHIQGSTENMKGLTAHTRAESEWDPQGKEEGTVMNSELVAFCFSGNCRRVRAPQDVCV